jgi:hypothetical protein
VFRTLSAAIQVMLADGEKVKALYNLSPQ